MTLCDKSINLYTSLHAYSFYNNSSVVLYERIAKVTPKGRD